MPSLIIVHYAEIALKGHNRKNFENLLCRRLAAALGDLAAGSVVRYQGRIGVPLGEQVDEAKIHQAMKRVFGVAHYAIGRSVEKDLEKLKERLLADLGRVQPPPASFAVLTRRSDKRFPMTSEQINREIGKTVQERLHLPVNLDEPGLTIGISVTETDILYSFEKHPGPGGMPANSAGRALGLLSGGIDSPVACYLMARRGAQLDLLHVHSYRSNEEMAADVEGKKILDLKAALAEYLIGSRLYLVPAYPFSVKASISLDEKIEMVMFRRFLFLLGQGLSRRVRCQAIVTGDSLGQVASQTLANLAAIDFDLALPVFRPLISYDKVDIVDLAKGISTYDISIRPYKDCCSIISRHPRTSVPVKVVKSIEESIGMPALVQEALSLAEAWPRGR